jgi:hypothetical protein
MSVIPQRPPIRARQLGLFALTQVAVMLLAISNESLWIDEFWTAHFAAMPSFKAFYELLIVPSGSQTPLHFFHFYLWGLLHPSGEFFFRLANLPLFVAGQLAVFWALRDYPRKFSYGLLALSALHPMVWQYANEARPYIMMFAGAQMILAYLLRLHAPNAQGRHVEPLFLLSFVLGGILLFGASMLGMFWVFAACMYALLRHLRQSTWRGLLQGPNPLLLALFLVAVAVLTAFYLNSLLHGAGASRISSSTPSTVAFAIYEVLGLSGIGPSRLELRDLGPAALAPYAVGLVAAVGILCLVFIAGLKEARQRLGAPELVLIVAFGLFPVVVVLFSGFAMHWRVLGRHLMAELPLLNLVLALGLVRLLHTDGRRGQRVRGLLAISCLLFFVCSSLSQRFAPRHRKDDYRAAAAVAQQAFAQGQRVWWAAGVIGARYYGLPGEFDVMSELIVAEKPEVCRDVPGVLQIANASTQCLSTLGAPEVVILSKPETFDIKGDIVGYLKAHRFEVVQSLPAFTVWRRPAGVEDSKP